MKTFFLCLIASLSSIAHQLVAQAILPPVPDWSGKSEKLIAPPDDKWVTHAEKSGFTSTPSYTETMAWLNNLCSQSKMFHMVSIGTSANNQAINMLIASSENAFTTDKLVRSSKKLILIQAGIHSGEIDGKDAGMMLLRDIAFRNKKHLLDDVNILFVPILSVDGHERRSPYNRVNQRGPENMGWRTNANNFNLNRDYTKLDTEEITAIVKVINEYDPDLYLDLHVTDGADYQYDITYGFLDSFSPRSGVWLREKLSPFVNTSLKDMGHIPGPLVFAANERDFTDGIKEYPYSPRYSNNYGDVRHLPSILLENHSLKPFRQRVLGTYVFLEAIVQVLGRDGAALQKAVQEDRKARNENFILTWKANPTRDSVEFLGFESYRKNSEVTTSDYVVWTGKPVAAVRLPVTRSNFPDKETKKPKAFYVPAHCKEVIARLKLHGIQMEQITERSILELNVFRIADYKFSTTPTEGHITVTSEYSVLRQKREFFPGSVKIDLDQPLGDLAMYLLHPGSDDSFFRWGFFPGIFTRTEYLEQYVAEPLAAKMLAEDPKLKAEFEEKKKNDPNFAKSPVDIYQWFYSRSPYYDSEWLIYPVAFE
jgi:hypothetical protein